MASPSLLLELLPVVESRSRDCRSSRLCRWRRSREVSEFWVEEVEGERLVRRREGGGERERERYRRTGERERERSRSTLPRDLSSSRVVTTSSRDLLKLDISSRIEREALFTLHLNRGEKWGIALGVVLSLSPTVPVVAERKVRAPLSCYSHD